jgi:hypothetical protein
VASADEMKPEVDILIPNFNNLPWMNSSSVRDPLEKSPFCPIYFGLDQS